ncbi:unnamed protein product [Timema podura]|uniref:Uncharacterized protein n=1 Tax=Timema podura TaxID=61482 RepID=A0ABN7NMC2_TIMPD|nr:unnamed protein product [Timema podura]
MVPAPCGGQCSRFEPFAPHCLDFTELPTRRGRSARNCTLPLPINKNSHPYSLEDVIEALVVDQTTLQEDVKKAIQQYRIDLNISPVAWSHLQLERKLYILTGGIELPDDLW